MLTPPSLPRHLLKELGQLLGAAIAGMLPRRLSRCLAQSPVAVRQRSAFGQSDAIKRVIQNESINAGANDLAHSRLAAHNDGSPHDMASSVIRSPAEPEIRRLNPSMWRYALCRE